MRTVRIPLNSRKYPGRFVLIDEEDVDLVGMYRWRAFFSCGNWYATTTVNRTTLYMHRLIANPQDKEVVDHVNHDGLDNRRVNLRCGSRSMNQQNRRGPQKTTGHPYLGIVWEKRRGKWRAEVRLSGRCKHLGYFEAPEDAARARDAGALKYYGSHATLNFPDNSLDVA